MQLAVEESAALHYMLLTCSHQFHNFGLRWDGDGEGWLASKVSFNVGNITHFISPVIFFSEPQLAENGSSTRLCAWTRNTELDYCRSEMTYEFGGSSGPIDSVFLDFICGISSVKAHFLCCVFQFLLAAVQWGPYFWHSSLAFVHLIFFFAVGFFRAAFLCHL